MKSKLTITVASILSVLVLVGVGFAAWVISNPDVNEKAESSITAVTVSDKSYTLQAEITGGEIVFGAPATMSADKPWLTAATGTAQENLNATLKLTLNYKDWDYVPTEFSVTMKSQSSTGGNDTVFDSLRDGTESTLTTLEKKNLITNPKIKYNSEAATEVTMNGNAVNIPKKAFTGYDDKDKDKDKTISLTITITFGWGEAFGGNNPYEYYNALPYAANHTKANTALTALYNLNTVKYVVTISGTTNKPGVSET